MKRALFIIVVIFTCMLAILPAPTAAQDEGNSTSPVTLQAVVPREDGKPPLVVFEIKRDETWISADRAREIADKVIFPELRTYDPNGTYYDTSHTGLSGEYSHQDLIAMDLWAHWNVPPGLGRDNDIGFNQDWITDLNPTTNRLIEWTMSPFWEFPKDSTGDTQPKTNDDLSSSKIPDVIKDRATSITGELEELGGVDFTSIELNYISERSGEDFGGFGYAVTLKKTTESQGVTDIKSDTLTALNYFFTGLALPNDRFWVNLNPWEPDRVVDEDVGKTNIGQIMLKADLQMKKDFCKYENPGARDTGADYWELLDKKQAELANKCMNDYPGQIKDSSNVLFQAATRHWIVPDEVTAYGEGDEIYIEDATLDIYSEPVYEHSSYEVINQDDGLLSEGCRGGLNEAAREYGRYAMEIEEESILPLVINDINNGEQYSELRQVYISLALAQWYKDHFQDNGMFSDLINTNNLAGLESESNWNPRDTWEAYVKSYQEGEYTYEKEETYQEGNYLITETSTYTSGGVDFEDIAEKVSISGGISEENKELLEYDLDKFYTSKGDDYYFSDYFYIPKAASLNDEEAEEESTDKYIPESPDSDNIPATGEIDIPASTEPEQDGFGCNASANESKSHASNGFLIMIGVPLIIGMVKYFNKRRGP